MLKRIRIDNIALLDTVELEFAPGLSVLTGETGAGKSVIVTALSLVLGGRADREYIRFRADSAAVEASFNISRMSADYKKDFAPLIENNELAIYRRITRDGKSKIKINGRSATLAQLKAVMAPMAEILGQHANQSLMNEDNHLDFLDDFAGIYDLKGTVSAAFYEWKNASERLAKIRKKREQILKERELLLFQHAEIDKAQVRVGEEEEIIAEKKVLDSARTLMASADLIGNILDGEENSVLSLVNLAQRELEKMAQTDHKLDKKSEEFADLTYRLQDLRGAVEAYGASIQDDPARIEEINLRLDEIYGLKKKYGGSEQAILDSLAAINGKLADSPEDIDGYIDQLSSECRALFDEYAKQALALSDTRQKAATYLQKLVVKELAELAIDNVGFEFEFVYEDDPAGVVINGRAVRPTANGLESGRILFSANPGEPLKSLVRTASGGEISRVLLALKAAQNKNAKLQHSLLIFDEVDAGIGGKTAVEVGKKLKKLSRESQMLVITHLHQIARQADHHFVAQKTSANAGSKGNRTTITVRQLDAVGIEHELKRMVALPG